MNLVRCENGHFFDDEKYAECPHCTAHNRKDELTVSFQPDLNAASPEQTPGSLSEAVKQATSRRMADEDDSVTVGSHTSGSGAVEPVVGWLVCVEGMNLGADYRLRSGRNFVGRAASMDVAISGDDRISRDRHAIIVYDPKSRKFMVQTGESKELFYLNDKVVLATTELKANDILSIGATKLMFIPCCGKSFDWESLKEAGAE